MDDKDVRMMLRMCANERKVLARAAAAARAAGRDQVAEGYVVLLQEIYDLELRLQKGGGSNASFKAK